ncbi:MAG: cytochrome c family protein [Myxococcota bacterium]|nr:cytochrome c family protein [Myxococcota bacterium]
MNVRIIGLGLALVVACGDDDASTAATTRAAEPTTAPTAAENPVATVDLDDPRTCATCHAAVVEEWERSMHAEAHQSRDPIYAALRTLRIERQGPQVAGQCGTCHHPLASSEPESPLAALGVSCRSCHGVAEVREGAGHAALVFADDRVMRGPHDLRADASPAHGTGPAAAHLTDGKTLCLACHREARNPQGVVTCNTGNELAEHADASATCTGCHMPTVETPSGAVSTRTSHRSHAFLGPHAAWEGSAADFLRSAVAMNARLDGDALVVSLENRSGHGFPSGYPGRLVVLQAIAKDPSGAEVWRAWREEASERPEVMLTQVYVDAEGQPVMAPFATAMARDSRLRPNETRELRFDVPPTTATVEVSLRFFLLPPKASQALGLAQSPLAAPRVIAEARATR